TDEEQGAEERSRSLPELELAEVGGVDPAGGQQRAELAQAGRLDLPDPLTAVVEPPADRLQGLWLLAVQPEATPQHRALVRRQVVEHGGQLGALMEQPRERGRGIG